MKIIAEVKVNAREEKIEVIGENHFRISVRAPAHEGKANRVVEELVARYFKVAPSLVMITSGKTSRQKVITISL